MKLSRDILQSHPNKPKTLTFTNLKHPALPLTLGKLSAKLT